MHVHGASAGDPRRKSGVPGLQPLHPQQGVTLVDEPDHVWLSSPGEPFTCLSNTSSPALGISSSYSYGSSTWFEQLLPKSRLDDASGSGVTHAPVSGFWSTVETPLVVDQGQQKLGNFQSVSSVILRCRRESGGNVVLKLYTEGTVNGQGWASELLGFWPFINQVNYLRIFDA